MKIATTLIVALLLPCVCWADEASHQKSAERLLEMSKSEEAMKTGFQSAIEPMLAAMTQRGMPPAAGEEIRTAFNQWFAEEMKWEEIRPKLVDLYVKEFTEAELKDLIAFYETPTGQKALTKLPAIMQQGAQIGQQYAATKQGALDQKIQAIIAKYRSEIDGAPGAPAPGAQPAKPAPPQATTPPASATPPAPKKK